ncbi:putative transcription factor MADS-type1 family [Medicago truncatula]|uniref:MADS-box transcription factor family protein n=1 Tax=Medicago truncatula TaxID=3880 RepID=A0A072UZY5_MEDTR|nr:agamous-like MADS-box protein AGL29 [Medicago truncatula]KEH31380.1 MADS-box transcription factor family protein [Medicago truncatula]RHN62865.1 putative transcription factor MADS-type1 family [Medicago truncatula]
MGRKKIEIELVDNKKARNVTFSKRRSGLFKKASDLSILCNARVGIVGFTPGGKPFAFGSPTFEAVTNVYLHGEEGESSRKNVKPSRNQNINKLNKELSDLTEELEEVDKGKASMVPTDLDLEELLKVKTSLKDLHGNIEAASSLLLLAKNPVHIIDLD